MDAGKTSLQAIDQSLNEIPELLTRHFESLRRQTTSPRFRGLEESLLHLHHKLDQLPRSFVEAPSYNIAEPIVLVPSLSSLADAPFIPEIPRASLHTLVKRLYTLQLKGLDVLPKEQSEQLLQALRALLRSTKDPQSGSLDVKTMLAIIEVARYVKLQRKSKHNVTGRLLHY